MGWIAALKCLLLGTRGCLRPCPIMPGIQCRCLLRTRPLVTLISTESPWVRLPGAKYVLDRVTRRVYSGQRGGEIMSVCVYRNEMEDWYGSFMSLIPFRLVAPPL
jgi:hypothetical protein